MKRGSMLYLKPDMASLATGSVNFPSSIYENPPDFILSLAKKMNENNIKPEIEIFDLSMLYSTQHLINLNLLTKPIHFQFVFGIKNALPASKEILEFQLDQMKKLYPDAHGQLLALARSIFSE